MYGDVSVVISAAGFCTELHRVKNLPCCESETFEVRFDPLSASLTIGFTKALLSIQVR